MKQNEGTRKQQENQNEKNERTRTEEQNKKQIKAVKLLTRQRRRSIHHG